MPVPLYGAGPSWKCPSASGCVAATTPTGLTQPDEILTNHSWRPAGKRAQCRPRRSPSANRYHLLPIAPQHTCTLTWPPARAHQESVFSSARDTGGRVTNGDEGGRGGRETGSAASPRSTLLIDLAQETVVDLLSSGFGFPMPMIWNRPNSVAVGQQMAGGDYRSS